jgi:hypothetical protein
MKSAKYSKKLSMLVGCVMERHDCGLFGHFLTSFLFPDGKQIDVKVVIGILSMFFWGSQWVLIDGKRRRKELEWSVFARLGLIDLKLR